MINLEEILLVNVPYLALFLAAFFDSLFIIGFIFYGTILFAIALTLLNNGSVTVLDIFIFSFLGAVVGDMFNFYIGYYLLSHKNIEKIKNKWSKKYKKADNIIQRYGVFAFIIGRFTGPARPMVPLVFGLTKFSPYKAHFFIFLACFIWVFFWITFLIFTKKIIL